jgi:hypothetical protein
VSATQYGMSRWQLWNDATLLCRVCGRAMSIGQRNDAVQLEAYWAPDVAVDEASVGAIEGAVSMTTIRVVVEVRPVWSVAT